MTRRAGHAVNAGLVATQTPLAVVAGTDFPSSVVNVVAWGGQAWLYHRAVVAGLDATGGAVDRELARSVGSLAGWRSGVLDLRADALVRLVRLCDAGRERVAGAVLDLPPDAVRTFVEAQQQRPLAWPLLEPSAPVARVGGFAGFGGTWSAPPRSVGRDASGHLVVRCSDDRTWRLEADVFGQRLTPAEEPVVDDGGVVGASVGPRSYLVELTGELA